MKAMELFKLYNLKNLNRNRGAILLISLSIFITMTVSLIIPQIQVSKESFIEDLMEKSSSADLVATQTFPSLSFESKIKEYESEGLLVEKISSSSIYLKTGENQVMIYLLTGYESLSGDECIISKSLADKYNLHIGDQLPLSSVSGNKKANKITAIESLPIDVFDDAEILGYVKSNSLEVPFQSNTSLFFLSGKEGKVLKSELANIESGFEYNTISH